MIIQILHALLKPALATMHATRFKALMAAVESGQTGASMSITALGRPVSGATHIKHKIKRMDRLVGNLHLNGECLALSGVIDEWPQKSLPMPLILFDWLLQWPKAALFGDFSRAHRLPLHRVRVAGPLFGIGTGDVYQGNPTGLCGIAKVKGCVTSAAYYVISATVKFICLWLCF